jgi:selenide,water dikinase
MPELVLLGGGHSHVEVLRRMGARPVPGARLTLISRERYTPYSGMLPGLLAGHYSFGDSHIDLEGLTGHSGAGFILDEVNGLEPRGRVVRCASGRVVAYDVLSIDVGSTPNLDVPGAAQHVVPVKPISKLLGQWDALRERVARQDRRRRIGVVGGGAGGVEVVLSVQHRLRRELRDAPRSDGELEYHLFCPEILPTHARGVRETIRRVLGERGVIVHEIGRVEAVEEGGVRTSDGTLHATDEILWVTDAAAPPWIAESTLAVDDRGFIRVHDTLQSVSHPGIYAAGDIASVAGYALPKSGVIAVRQGPVLANNLRAVMTGGALRSFRPRRHYLSLITMGTKHAVASYGDWSASGAWVWHLKDWIDRRFVRRYNRLRSSHSSPPKS